MNLIPYDKKDGMKVWLDHSEAERFIDAAEDTEQRIAFLLGVRSGLRESEIVQVTPGDIVETTAGPRVRVWEGKGDKFRETPAPRELVQTATAYADASDIGMDTPLVDKSTRTIERWVSAAGDRLADHTGDDGWRYVTPHDLRRTWATLLSAEDVNAMLVLDWGGWDDIETFLEHYRGSYSPAVQQRELEKVPWLDGDAVRTFDDPEVPRTRILEASE